MTFEAIFRSFQNVFFPFEREKKTFFFLITKPRGELPPDTHLIFRERERFFSIQYPYERSHGYTVNRLTVPLEGGANAMQPNPDSGFLSIHKSP